MMTIAYLIAEVNQMSHTTFVEVFGGIFEDTPEIATQAWIKRPFPHVNDLHQKMIAIVNEMSEEGQLSLICAHPDLGSKVKMAEASIKEQAGVGLDQMNFEEFKRFEFLNHSYKDKFGFPFIIAVKKQTKDSILEAFECRLQNTLNVEKQQALVEISEIARFRLRALIRN